ncbi:MAG: hypothetical protein NVS3B21_23520 [Acidimicrobiales bacterium]
MRRCKQWQWADPQTQQDDPVKTECIEQTDQVFDHRLLKATVGQWNPVGDASPSLVTPDMAAERRKSFEELRQPRLIPHVIDREVR